MRLILCILAVMLLSRPVFADVVLAWDGAEGEVPVGGYNVYRSQVPGEFSGTPVNAQPITTTTYRDPISIPGTYFYVVRTVSDAGALSPPSNETTAIVGGSNRPPSVSIKSPKHGEVITAKKQTVSAAATDDAGVVWMELFIKDVLCSSGSRSTLSCSWNTAPYKGKGPVVIRSTARDAEGAVASEQITVTVKK